MPRGKRRKKTTRKPAKKTAPAPRAPRRPGRPTAHGAVPAAITGLQQAHRELLSQRVQLDTQIASIESAMQALGSAPVRMAGGARRGAGRPGARAGSLKDHITQVLGSGGVMSVKDIAEGVVTNGYQSRNKTLAKSVGIALTQMPNVQKVARGQFCLK